MIKEYRDGCRNPITELQIEEQPGSYYIVYYEPDTHFLKKIVEHSKNEIFQIKYFIKDTENEAEVIRDLSKKSILFDVITEEIINGFKVLTIKRFKTKKNFRTLAKEVYEITDHEYRYMICGQVWDEDNLKPVLDSTYKYYYSLDENGNKVEGVVFTYFADGNIKLATDMTPYYDNHKFWDEYTSDNFQDLQDLFTIDISYYKTADLVPSEGIFKII